MSKKAKQVEAVMSEAMTVNRKAGADLVKAGLAVLKNEFDQRAVAFVTGTINQIKTLSDQIDRYQGHLQYQKDRLAAIHAGEFVIDFQGNIRFKDARLNDGLS